LMAGILFTLVISAGKPAVTSLFCSGITRSGVRICLEDATEDPIMRERSPDLAGEAKTGMPAIALLQTGPSGEP
jgi:hypothetical protein